VTDYNGFISFKVVYHGLDHLITPGIPEVWEAMDHDNQWSLAYTGIVDVYSVIICIMMCHLLVDVIGKLVLRPASVSFNTPLSMNDAGLRFPSTKRRQDFAWKSEVRVFFSSQ
jgi:hypothetical protein